MPGMQINLCHPLIHFFSSWHSEIDFGLCRNYSYSNKGVKKVFYQVESLTKSPFNQVETNRNSLINKIRIFWGTLNLLMFMYWKIAIFQVLKLCMQWCRAEGCWHKLLLNLKAVVESKIGKKKTTSISLTFS